MGVTGRQGGVRDKRAVSINTPVSESHQLKPGWWDRDGRTHPTQWSGRALDMRQLDMRQLMRGDGEPISRLREQRVERPSVPARVSNGSHSTALAPQTQRETLTLTGSLFGGCLSGGPC